jgi:hypothetical protein
MWYLVTLSIFIPDTVPPQSGLSPNTRPQSGARCMLTSELGVLVNLLGVLVVFAVVGYAAAAQAQPKPHSH